MGTVEVSCLQVAHVREELLLLRQFWANHERLINLEVVMQIHHQVRVDLGLIERQ
jgi:hypothetical protein